MNPFDHGFFETDELREFGFKSVGRNVKIARKATLVGLSNISIGDNVRIDDGVTIAAHAGSLTLGSYIHIGGGCYLGCAGGITMEDFSGLSHGVKLYSATDDYAGEALTNPTVPHKYLKVTTAPILLGKHVIIGSGSVVMPDVTLGEGAAVGALSFVPRSLEAWGLYAGMPAKKIKERSRRPLELEKELRAEQH